jgi:uncharacterized protein (DUF3084 family)
MWTKKNQTHTTNMKINFLAAWSAALSFLGLEAKEQEVEVTSETIEKFNNELQARADQIVQLTSDLEAANTAKTESDNKVSNLSAELETAKTTISEQNEKIEALKQNPKVTAAAIQKEKDNSGEKDDLNDFIAKNEDDTAACIAKLKEAGY